MKNSIYAISAEKEALVEVKYEHRIVRSIMHSAEAAKLLMPVFQQILDDLAKTNSVYIRRAPEYGSYLNEETMEICWYASMRYSFTPQGPHGIQTVNRAYDNDNMVTGFGLAPYMAKDKEDVTGRVFRTNACD
jgi:hypothetical protein